MARMVDQYNLLITVNAYLICVVREIDLVEYLSRFVLYGFNLNLMGWVLALAIPDSFLQPLQRILSYGMPPCPQE